MQYQYTATNPEGKKLTGVINAANDQEARDKLGTLGFSILALTESTEPVSTKTDIDKFEFEAIDKIGKKIKGTVPAKELLLAYTRLIEEYHFTINYIAAVSATPEEKQNMRGPGLEEIKGQYDLGKGGKKQDEEMKSMVESPEFVIEKEALMKQVDEITQQIKTLLAKFQGKLSPEMQAKINNNMDKLLRIKSSNNLDYIRNTCKELLDQVQNDEMFLNNLQHGEERQQMMMESQHMMAGLKKPGLGSMDIGDQIKSSIIKAEEKLKDTKWEFLLNPMKSLKMALEGTPETQAIKYKLKNIRSQKWNALKLALKSPKEIRQANWDNVKTLQKQEKELKAKFKTIRKLRHEQNSLVRQERHLYAIEEISTFTGWLLFFYLAYYFLGHYAVTQDLSISPFLGIPFDLRDSALFKYLLAFIFLVHSAASLKVNFFIRSKAASIVLITATIVLSLMTLFNF